MAKKSTLMDKMPNRKYVTVPFAAATTTASYTQFDTMMGAREGAGWLISRVDVSVQGVVPIATAATAQALRFQVCTGAQTAPLAVDDDEVIATIDTMMTATKGYDGTLPLSWVGPVIVASRQLTCSMIGTPDAAPWRLSNMLFTIWYQWVKLGAREWVEIAEARGIA